LLRITPEETMIKKCPSEEKINVSCSQKTGWVKSGREIV
jgi:hypothetical protein